MTAPRRTRGRVTRKAGPPAAAPEAVVAPKTEAAPKAEVAPRTEAAPRAEVAPVAEMAAAPAKASAEKAPAEKAPAEKASATRKAPAKKTAADKGSNGASTRSGSRGGRGRGRSSQRSADVPRSRAGRDDYQSSPGHGGVQKMEGANLRRQLPRPGRQPKGSLRITALGGIGEIGRNMTTFEYAGRILIIDCGVLFPSSTEPGVDLILPDFSPIEDRLDKVEALVLTHAHEDHIGAIPYLLRMRPDIPIVGSRFTLALVAAKCREHRLRPNFVQVAEGERVRYGKFECEFFAVNHSIPDALGIALRTPAGMVVHTGDIKLDQLPPDRRPTDLPALGRLGDEGVDLFLVDSTNATTPGVSMSESEIAPTMRRLVADAKRRVIVASFASNVYRVQQVIDAAVAANRRIALAGRSMLRNMEIAQELGFLTIPDGFLVDIDAASKLPPEKVVLITTGTQGEPMAALSRMSRGEHRQIKVQQGDTIILSSSLVPGNEKAVFGVINNLAQLGARVITGRDAKVHVSGHGYAGELLFLYNAVRPSNVMPVHGEWRHLQANAELAVATGVGEDNVVVTGNGVVVDLLDGRARIAGEIPVGHLYVDGLHTGDVGEEVLSDRTALGEGGIIAVTVVVDQRTGRPAQTPQVIGKGFSDEPGALEPVVELVENALLDLAGEGENDPFRMAQAVRRTVGRWVQDKWRRRPMIVPTVVVTGKDD